MDKLQDYLPAKSRASSRPVVMVLGLIHPDKLKNHPTFPEAALPAANEAFTSFDHYIKVCNGQKGGSEHVSILELTDA